ncbi:vanadium-dependent haloperoxidase [Aridibaculum aurantiacum]|uniref:vanadium-dependent haloperoxidase n=1 Tax=Aridibaculum aurantiacum TaxID=2810307 RepID=UPI001A97B5F7|nr:vanadium-dependent haloperoxidase [Aridibaculum aurantiacum]
MLRIFLAITALCLFLSSCRKYDDVVPSQPAASEFSSTVAIEWMEQYRQAVKNEGLNPPRASRFYAYAGIALYEAVLPGIPGNRSVEGQVPLLANLPKIASFTRLQYNIALNEAMYRVAKGLLPNASAATKNQLDALYKKYNDQLNTQVHETVKNDSREFGYMVAQSVLNRANKDGMAETTSMVYTVPGRTSNAANWAPTGAVLNPLEPFWGKVKCFAMLSSSECEEAQAIPFSSTPGSAFYNQAVEVYQVSQNLTQDQRNIAQWWADGAGTPTPPGHWVGIANQLAKEKNLPLAKTAEMHLMLGIGLADAFISCWDAKYKYNLLRPQTYIRDYLPGASSWSSFISTPPFPEYPSGHSVSSGAAAEILTGFFGNISFTDKTNTSMGLPARTYNSLRDAANEAAMSRLYGGIHYREGNENGVKQGKTVGEVVFKNIKLK